MKLLKKSRTLVPILIVLRFCCSCSAASRVLATPASSKAPEKTVLAYYENRNSDAAFKSFYRNIHQISTDTYSIDGAGDVTGKAPASALQFAAQHKIPSYMAISNWGTTDFSPSIAHQVLSNAAAQSRAISDLLSLLPGHGYAGVNIDLESVNAGDRAAFSSFVTNVSQRMHDAGYTVIVSVPAEQVDNPSDPWTGAFDYKTLAQSADVLQVMTYDQHGPWSAPGPVAGNDWVLRTVQFAITVASPRKLSLGLPAYGYDWNLTAKTGVQIHWNQIPALLTSVGATPQRDSASGAPYFDYTAADGSKHQVWYEDATSIAAKANYAVTYHLAGVSEFALGFDDQSFWEAVQSGLNPAASDRK